MFTAIVSLEKCVDKWSNENGAEGNPRFVDSFRATLSANTMEGMENSLRNWVSNHGVSFGDFSRFETEESPNIGRFEFCCTEDDRGGIDKNGNWLADYSLWVEMMKSTETLCPSFGLTSE